METAKKEKQKKEKKSSQQKPEKNTIATSAVCGCGCIGTTPVSVKK